MPALKLKAAQFGGSRLYGGPGAGPRLLERQISADELLAKGPVGGPNGPQERRHQRIVACKDRLLDTGFFAEAEPEALCAALSEAQANPSDTSAKTLSYAQSRLASVVLGRVQNSFLETALAPSRSSLRKERLPQLRSQIAWSSKFRDYCGKAAQAEFAQLEGDTLALVAEQRARALQQQATDLEQARARRAIMESPKMQRAAPQSRSVADLRSQAAAARPDSAEQQRRIVREALQMLREWRSHGEVAHALCDCLLRMVQDSGESFREEMQQRGLGALASTVADMHQDRVQVARCAMRLMAIVSPQLLLDVMRESFAVQGATSTVRTGLEVLNWLTQSFPDSIDDIARLGGRELIAEVQPAFAADRLLTLHCLNMRRRLMKSRARSVLKTIPKEIDAAADDVIRLRALFDTLDEDGSGFIDVNELSFAFKCMGMKLTKEELQKAVLEVDNDGSGRLEWPEFLSLMNKYGKGQSIEASFSAERLAELKETFNVFDANGDGTLDVTELDVVFKSLGLRSTEKEIRDMIATVDADDSGSIGWPEFLFLMSKKNVSPEDQQRLAWEFFIGSQDTKARLEKDVFVEKMQGLSADFTLMQLEDMIFQAKFEDGDLDAITYKEFCKLLMR